MFVTSAQFLLSSDSATEGAHAARHLRYCCSIVWYKHRSFGCSSFSAAIASYLTAGVGGSIPRQRDAGGDDQVPREVSITSLTAVRTIGDAIATQKSTRLLLARGSLGIGSLHDPVKRKRIYSIPRRTEFILKCRGHFQQLLVKAIINVLESLIEHHTSPLLTQECSTILTIAKEADTKKLFWPEVFSDPT